MITSKGIYVAATSLMEDFGLEDSPEWRTEFCTAIVEADMGKLRAFEDTVRHDAGRFGKVFHRKNPYFISDWETPTYPQLVRQQTVIENWLKAIKKAQELMPMAREEREARMEAQEAARQHELAMQRASFEHAERLKQLDLEIERVKLEAERVRQSAEHANQAAERDHAYRVQELIGKLKEQELKLTQPHDLKRQQNDLLRWLVQYQSELAAKADKTDFEKEMDTIVESIVKMFEMARSVPDPRDKDGNLDDFAADAQYQMVIKIATELINARLAGAKKDLAG